jgi:hypothetical protein
MARVEELEARHERHRRREQGGREPPGGPGPGAGPAVPSRPEPGHDVGRHQGRRHDDPGQAVITLPAALF